VAALGQHGLGVELHAGESGPAHGMHAAVRRVAGDLHRAEGAVHRGGPATRGEAGVEPDPPPRTGFVERSLVAAYAGGLTPILCLTKSDLADPEPFAAEFAGLDLTVVTAGRTDPLERITALVAGKVTVFLGHSGVGKSTLVNRLVPEAHRAVGVVSGVGKGRHTSTQSVALPLDGSGWVIDTPGIRSFGLAHVTAADVMQAFSDLAEAIEDCPRGCGHMGPPADPECALDTLTGHAADRVIAARRLLVAMADPANVLAVDDIAVMTGYEVRPAVASKRKRKARKEGRKKQTQEK